MCASRSASRSGLTLNRRALLAALPALATPAAFAGEPQTAQQTTVEPSSELEAWLDRFGRPTTRVMLNGHGPFDFMVDTGANSTAIRMSLALIVGATFNGMATVHGTTGSSNLPMAQMADLQAGAASRQDFRVAVMPDDLLWTDGVLGADVFAGKRLYFDIARRTVRIETARRGASRTGTRVATYDLNIRNGMLAELTGRVGRVEAKLMIDTGAEACIVNLALSEKLQRAHPRLERLPRVKVTGITGHVLEGDYIKLPDVKMGSIVVAQAGAVAGDAPIFDVWKLRDEPAMIVGVDVLSRLNGFTIDYGARRFEAKPLALVAGSGLRLET